MIFGGVMNIRGLHDFTIYWICHRCLPVELLNYIYNILCDHGYADPRSADCYLIRYGHHREGGNRQTFGQMLRKQHWEDPRAVSQCCRKAVVDSIKQELSRICHQPQSYTSRGSHSKSRRYYHVSPSRRQPFIHVTIPRIS